MKKYRLFIYLIIFTLITGSFWAYAADEAPIDTAEVLELYMGETKMIQVSNPTRIAISNPSVVDVASATKSRIVLSPKAVGKTTLVVWDNFGEQSYQIKVFTEDINDIKRRIDNILAALKLSAVRTQAVEEEGKVLLMGRVKTAQEREKINIAIGALKDKVVDLIEVKEEEAVIDIDVQILELNRDASNTLGLTWPGALNLIEKGSPGIADAGTKWGTLFKILNLQRGTATGADPFTFKLDALVQEGKARILSQPRLACQSGKEAELLVGGEKPIFTTQVASAGGAGTQVEYKEYGIKLKIKPTVLEDRRIKIALNVEVSDVGAAETIGDANAPSAKAYPLTIRNASTELILNSGQTLVIGGLKKQKSEEDIRKVPFLGDTPVIGWAFRKKTRKEGGGQGERGNTELFISITPEIISKGETVEEREKKSITTEIEPLVKAEEVSEPVSQPEIEDVGRQVRLETKSPQATQTTNPAVAYSQIVQKRILEKITYPASAKETGFWGTVKLGLHISYSGELLEVVVKESSGRGVLDQQAVNVAKGIGSFPPFPSSIAKDDIWIDVPIKYSLD